MTEDVLFNGTETEETSKIGKLIQTIISEDLRMGKTAESTYLFSA